MASTFFPISPQAAFRMRTVEYMSGLYKHQVAVQDVSSVHRARVPPPIPPPDMSARLVRDCQDIVQVIMRAARTKYELTWDGHRYADSLAKTAVLQLSEEDKRLRRYPPLIPAEDIIAGDRYYGLIDHPAIIVDCHGNILVWTLPKIIPKHRQEELLAITRHVEGRLTVREDPENASPGQQWRTGSRFFREGNDWMSGILYLSAGWFPLGQQGDNCRPRCTDFLRLPEGQAWMSALQEIGALIDGILAITHPRLYEAGLEVQRRLAERLPDLREHLGRWPWVFNCAQVSVNRMSIHHRDYNGRPGWVDFLLSVGTYGERAVMAFRNLGATVPFDSGSVVLPVSRVVIHAVPAVPADRIAYTLFMSDKVHEWVRVEDPGWEKEGGRRRVD
ncbi:hypothetical protein K466DRAFT_611054 [Polyporus arcularius HHB13444]|uniref:2OGFeDO JBP1/TET oxygenase domain-containing protein n=1 Tax=Polyporus arcularius HHB13444 TaxID=1314778 RepID=A0A5C3PHI2_9APHY|nr:hypothetical protein K466DRAFT_611054 [Polyporus arcularius HHB13444]